MLNKILNFYIITWILIFIISLIDSNLDKLDIVIFNLMVALLYYVILKVSVNKLVKRNSGNLIIIVLIFSILYIIFINQLSYKYTNNYLVFSTGDAVVYDSYARKIIYNLNDAWKYLKNFSFDDWGGIIVVSFAYLICDSNLMLNFIYLIFALISCYYLYKLSLFFMNKEFSFLASISFFLSSYVLWFESSGLKETVMIMLIILSYYNLYMCKSKNKSVHIFLSGLFLFALFFFRPIVPIFIMISFILPTLLQSKNNTLKIFLIFITLGISILFSFIFDYFFQRFGFVGDDNFYEILESDGLIKGGLFFTYLVNIIAAFIGPLPSFYKGKELISYIVFFTPGLYLKNILSYFFLIGSASILKKRNYFLMPILIFPLLEMISLIYILESLELRKSLPHFPMIYIIIFWALYKIQTSESLIKIKKIWYSYFFYLLFLVIIVIIWNFRN